MRLSVVIPAHNEQGSIAETVAAVHRKLAEEGIAHEIVVVDDNSSDGTKRVLMELTDHIPTLIYRSNDGLSGYGNAVCVGLREFSGDCVAVMMADLSDSPDDLVKFYRKMQEGFECVFGNRWTSEAEVVDYPFAKKILNRIANTTVRLLFGFKYGDCTNAFKLYRRETIEGLQPFLSPHFNLTLELPLKAIVRGYSYAVVPCSWKNRKSGESKLRVKEMGSRYFFILLYCLIEKYFSRGDYHKTVVEQNDDKNKACAASNAN